MFLSTFDLTHTHTPTGRSTDIDTSQSRRDGEFQKQPTMTYGVKSCSKQDEFSDFLSLNLRKTNG